jgi:hypothetical protein
MKKFDIGEVVATPAALSALEQAQVNPFLILGRHLGGDWGDLDADDKKANDRAIDDGTRILSRYNVGDTALYVITEASREVTTIMLRSEY